MNVQGLGGFGPLSFGGRLRLRGEQPRQLPRGDPRGLRELVLHLDDLRDGIARLRGLAGPRRATTVPGKLLAAISDPLGLDLRPGAVTLRSTRSLAGGQVSTNHPEFEGASTAAATLGGVYDGSYGDTTLTFRVKQTAEVGKNNFRVELVDEGGKKVDEAAFDASYVPGTPVLLASGLTLALDAGRVRRDDQFQVDVSGAGVPIAPDEELVDSGILSAGSFTINDVALDVGSGDTLNDLLDRITELVPQVDASFDALAREVVLQAPSGAEIVLGADTAGFFETMGLADATHERDGGDLDRTLKDVARFADTQAGSILIGGVPVSVDPAVDSLRTILERIADETAIAVDTELATGRIRFEGDGPFALADGGTGFLSALGLDDATYGVRLEDEAAGAALPEPDALQRALGQLGATLQALASLEFDSRSGPIASAILGRVRSALEGALEAPGGEGFGLSLAASGDGLEGLRFDRTDLARAIGEDPEGLLGFLAGGRARDGFDGLIPGLDAAQGAALDLLRANPLVRGNGFLLDVLA